MDAASKQPVDQYFYIAYTMPPSVPHPPPPPHTHTCTHARTHTHTPPRCGELVILNFTELDKKVRDQKFETTKSWRHRYDEAYCLFAQMCLEGMVIPSNRIYMYYY